jgi:hypothetical protein
MGARLTMLPPRGNLCSRSIAFVMNVKLSRVRLSPLLGCPPDILRLVTRTVHR